MLADIGTMMWKEWKEFLLQRGTVKGGAIAAIGIPLALLGVYMPWQTGAQWVHSPLLLLAWSWVPLLLITTLAADSFAGERERKTLETLLASRLSDRTILFGKMAMLVSYGWGLTLAALVLSIVTLNSVHRGSEWVLPPAKTALTVVILSLLFATLGAAGGTLVSLRASTARQAAQTVSIALMVFVLAVVLLARLIPWEWKAAVLAAPVRIELIAGALLVAINAVLIAAAVARFRRARLILD